jgi:hypothetical protein
MPFKMTNLRSIIAYVYMLALFSCCPVPFLCYWKTTHLIKIRHLDLPHYLGLTPTFKRVGIIFVTNFPNGLRPCHPKLPSSIFWPNRKLHLVRQLNVLQQMPSAPFFKPSFVNIYDTLPSSLIDSNVSLKWNIGRVRNCGTLPNSQDFGGRRASWSFGMGLGRMTSNSIIHTGLHKTKQQLD